jgi:hypothetical protein
MGLEKEEENMGLWLKSLDSVFFKDKSYMLHHQVLKNEYLHMLVT